MKIVRCCCHGEVVEIDASEFFFTLSFSKHSKLTVLASRTSMSQVNKSLVSLIN